MKKITIIIIAILFMAAPVFSYGQTEEGTQPEKNISYTFINEYGLYTGGTVGFTGIFVNGIKFNKTQDVIGLGIGYEVDAGPFNFYYSEGSQSVPIFVNYRHYFPSKRKLKPLVNIAVGARFSFWTEYNYWYDDWGNYYSNWQQQKGVGLYGTAAAGFKVKAFSFTSGFFVKSWNNVYFGGVEVKVGFTF